MHPGVPDGKGAEMVIAFHGYIPVREHIDRIVSGAMTRSETLAWLPGLMSQSVRLRDVSVSILGSASTFPL